MTEFGLDQPGESRATGASLPPPAPKTKGDQMKLSLSKSAQSRLLGWGEAAEFFLYGERSEAERLQSALFRVGRDKAPELLWHLVCEGALSADAIASQVGPVWSAAEYPDRMLQRWEWRSLFRIAGFTRDGQPQPRPTEPMRLYRGSVPERRLDWSWTTSPAVARGYALGTAARRPNTGTVWTALVPPAQLLAAIDEREEAEYVVDTNDLAVEALSTQGCP